MIFAQPFFTQMLLPFLFVFVVIFAILQKSKILGDGKAQVDSLVALVIGLITIGLPPAREFIVLILPWLGVGVAVILLFLVLYGFVAGDLQQSMPKGIKIAIGILAAIFTIAIVVYYSGFWKILKGGAFLSKETWTTIFLILIMAGAVIWVVASSAKNTNSSSTD